MVSGAPGVAIEGLEDEVARMLAEVGYPVEAARFLQEGTIVTPERTGESANDAIVVEGDGIHRRLLRVVLATRRAQEYGRNPEGDRPQLVEDRAEHRAYDVYRWPATSNGPRALWVDVTPCLEQGLKEEVAHMLQEMGATITADEFLREGGIETHTRTGENAENAIVISGGRYHEYILGEYLANRHANQTGSRRNGYEQSEGDHGERYQVYRFTGAEGSQELWVDITHCKDDY